MAITSDQVAEQINDMITKSMALNGPGFTAGMLCSQLTIACNTYMKPADAEQFMAQFRHVVGPLIEDK